MKKKFAQLQLLIAVLLPIVGFAQIPPGYYDDAYGHYGDDLKAALHDIIDDHTEYSYDALRDYILKNTDEDPDNSSNVILLYTGRSQNKNTFGGGPDDWNREHVWAKSHGDFGTSPPAGSDAHHIRPTDASVNSSRGNKDFDNGGQQHPEATGCYYDEDSWEPRDEVKGDVARMIFYMAVRYEGGSGEPDLEVVDMVNTYPNPEHGKLSTLLEWNNQDPPDDFEINRNEVIYFYQHNRNPFIDHPSFVDLIWDYTIGIDPLSESDIRVYPNPVKNKATVTLDRNTEHFARPVLLDIVGRQIEVPVESSGEKFVLDMSQIPCGSYFLRIESRDGRDVHNIKLIK